MIADAVIFGDPNLTITPSTSSYSGVTALGGTNAATSAGSFFIQTLNLSDVATDLPVTEKLFFTVSLSNLSAF
jgi:hypothetical protein